MRRCVGGNEILLPASRCAVLVVALQCLLVVFPLVPKNATKSLLAFLIDEKSVPVIMSDFVPEMAQDCSIRLMQQDAPRFPLGVIGLGEIDCDDTEVMARQNRRARQVGKKRVRDAVFRVFNLAFDRQAKPQQAVVEATFRGFEFGPGCFIAVDAQVRDDFASTGRRRSRYWDLRLGRPSYRHHARCSFGKADNAFRSWIATSALPRDLVP